MEKKLTPKALRFSETLPSTLKFIHPSGKVGPDDRSPLKLQQEKKQSSFSNTGTITLRETMCANCLCADKCALCLNGGGGKTHPVRSAGLK